ncbi:MAG: deoxyguanosinetriphosphate triphosphohydrolase [Phycisphaerae bacterium]|nr:deoxyguanosinetriphosphate triphosphohydrolase [Phycisphaerae bacterium]
MASGESSSPRERYEASQQQWLAPYAVTEADSGGRKAEEKPHPYRTCFQRDRDRIVHCSAFRRLDFKTQVFVPHECDHFRTRLTHTMEVAQIARSLGRALRLNEDLIEAVSLAHDLGHPPFGHGGEAALNELMADHGGFEHNRQSLRIVDYLEHPYPRFRGLNLTRTVRECLAKHRTQYDTPVCEEFAPDMLGPLEGQLVDLADEIAYTSADLEDALAAGWIDSQQLSALSLWRRAQQVAEADSPDAKAIHKRIRAGKAVLADMANDLIATTEQNIGKLGIVSADDARAAGRRCAAFCEPMAAAVKEMQNFLLNEVYLNPVNTEQDRRGRQIIRELFGAYLADENRLPQRYRQRVEAGRTELAAGGRHRVICDYVAGMTDRFCKQQHARICT